MEKEKLKANEHEREMERKRLEFEMMWFEENSQARTQRGNGKNGGITRQILDKLFPSHLHVHEQCIQFKLNGTLHSY